MNEQNLNREGRRPTFTRLSAFQMLENRRLYGAEKRITAAEFIELMVKEGELKEKCSVATMQRLLNGRMFPDLCKFDAGGKETTLPYDYEGLPKCTRGQPPKEERLNSDGSLKPNFSKLSQKLLDEIDRRVEAKAATAAELICSQYLEGLNKRVAALEQR